MKYFSHVLRSERELLLIRNKVPGSRLKGRPLQRRTDVIRHQTGLNFQQCIQRTEDRMKWCALIGLLQDHDTLRG